MPAPLSVPAMPTQDKPDDPVAVALRMGNAVFAAGRGQRTAYVGRTWGEFKRAVAQLCVTDDDVLSSIEYGIAATGSGYIVRDDDADGAVELREMAS